MKLSWTAVCTALSLIDISFTVAQTPRIAPQCLSRDPDGTCVLEAEDEEEEEEDFFDQFDEDNDGPFEHVYPEKCGLYMAESSIPNAGWGMFANQDIEQGDPILPLDVSIQALDLPPWVNSLGGPKSWLLSEYVWNSDMLKSQFMADEVNSVVPGLGMLANSHPGLVNAANEGSLHRRPWTDRSNPVTGSFSEYQDLTFSASQDIQKGQEIFVEYGDHWFEHRGGTFENIPLSNSFLAADHLMNKWKSVVSGKLNEPLSQELWDASIDILSDYYFFERVFNALPKTGKDAANWMTLYPKSTTARASVPNLIRSEEWLEENGMCLDNIQVKDAGEKGKGAFATRFLPKGSLVAPAPVIHLSREHLKMKWEESYDSRKPSKKRKLWEGDQLLLNYCYGNPMTSLVFFPYSPAVNLINHGKAPNVAIRWSNMTKKEMLEWSTKKVLAQNHKAGLMMEIYALRDIQPGEEVLLDYGEDWQHSWDMHEATYIHPVNGEDFKVAWDYDTGTELYANDDPRHPPPYIETRCWIDYDPDTEDEEGFYLYAEIESSDLGDTTPCTLIGKEILGDETWYQVKYVDEETDQEIKVKGVSWNMITYVDKPYTGNQHLRQGFRHYIELPDEMIPPSWRDLGLNVEDNSECGMYMAESAIPNSGLGMYTAREVSKDKRIFFGDVVVQVEDIFDNNRLRLMKQGKHNVTEKEWLLEHYFWTAESSLAQYDAGFIESMVPGFGMLANSHTGLHNSAMRIPTQTTDLHRGMDPGAGVATTYHDVHYVAEKDLEAGEEIFVEYGDNYFDMRDDLWFVPLSGDFKRADNILKKFLSHVGGDFDNERARDLFDVFSGIYKNYNNRMANALPKTIEDAKIAREKGSAEINVPDKVRSIEWLKENGVCIDNIVPAKSRIIQAGRGAFATRKIKKGEIVSPVPVVQIRRDDVEIYDGDDLHRPTEIWLEGNQIILNYCYGHPESSLLLFPYAPSVNYVNHHHTKYNVELRWSNLPNHKSEWLDMRPRDFLNLDHAGLIMEMVATRDIEVGEEIYLNYGDDWEQKWTKYVAEWKADPNEGNYISAAKLNQQVEWLRTVEELRMDPYPPTVFTACWLAGSLHHARSVGPDGRTQRALEWRYAPNMFNDAENIDECDIISRETKASSFSIEHERDSYRPPDITYTVVFHRRQDPSLGPLTVKGVPRSAIMFLDHMYTNDQYVRGTFRHEIGLPDEMVPDIWRDLKK